MRHFPCPALQHAQLCEEEERKHSDNSSPASAAISQRRLPHLKQTLPSFEAGTKAAAGLPRCGRPPSTTALAVEEGGTNKPEAGLLPRAIEKEKLEKRRKTRKTQRRKQQTDTGDQRRGGAETGLSSSLQKEERESRFSKGGSPLFI